jgi:3-hydroxyisobutyrate dehydrogenase/2-hydroxy-3-oxopropionate reductase
MSSMQRVAVIGTGRMGSAMAATLGRHGFDLVLWNRSRVKAQRVAEAVGGAVADTAADAAAKAEFVVSSLADDEAVRSVYLDDAGIVAGVDAGAIVMETSTIDPTTVHVVGAAIDAAGARFLDAPVSGSVSTVEAGSLTIMAGGDADVIERAQPVLDALAARVIRVGDRGAGAVAKLAVNALVHGLNVALSEALVLAEKAGVDRSLAYEVFASGAAGAPFVHYKRQAYEHPEEAVVAFSLDLVAKDLELITALGRRVGAEMDQADVGLAIVHRAIAAGLGDADMSAVATYLRGLER